MGGGTGLSLEGKVGSRAWGYLPGRGDDVSEGTQTGEDT